MCACINTLAYIVTVHIYLYIYWIICILGKKVTVFEHIKLMLHTVVVCPSNDEALDSKH